jgi:uncharacterized protein YcbK (DUF882 family)
LRGPYARLFSVTKESIEVAGLNRRSFLKLGAFAAMAYPALASAVPSSAFLNARSRSLSFYNLHTGEKLKSVYWEAGAYIPESLAGINRILRDHRNGEIHPIAPRLLDVLCEVAMGLDTREPFEIISGYRSPATNAMLHKQSQGVAEHSLHMDGIAADIHVPGRSLALLRKTAVALKAGGVGYYPESQFVHIDVGRVRTW